MNARAIRELPLSATIVRRFRAERSLGESISRIASRYGVSCQTVVRSMCGETFKRARPGLANTRGPR